MVAILDWVRKENLRLKTKQGIRLISVQPQK